jgi:hypothetical protein
MDDPNDFLRKLYGPRMLALVALTFAFTLALGLWIHWMLEPAEGLFSSPLGPVSLAAGAAIGQVVAGFLARRHLGS